MNTIDKLNNTLGYLTAMSFDRPELINNLVEPLNTLSEAISEVENLSLYGVSHRRELLLDFLKWQSTAYSCTNNLEGNSKEIDLYLKSNNCG